MDVKNLNITNYANMVLTFKKMAILAKVVFITHSVTKTGICVTCFECKISLTDFKSPHGHNFCGNRNYYVVPKDLAQTIKDFVPDDIGIIAYYGNNRLRKIKECKYQEISDELKCRLLYDALKKWCDGKQSKI